MALHPLRLVVAYSLLWSCGIHQVVSAQPPEPVRLTLSDRLTTDDIVDEQQAYSDKANKPKKSETPSNDQLIKRIESLEADCKKAKEEAEAAKNKSRASPTFKLGGQIVMDSLWFSQSPTSRAALGDVQDSFDFRRARLYAQGEYEKFNYATGFDFAQGTATNGRPAFLDNIGLREVPVVQNLRVGHFFEPFTLERSSSNRNSMFMERSLADAFAPARNLGVMVFGENETQSVFWALGSFRSDTDNFGDDAGDQEGQSVDARLVYRPYYDEACEGRHMLHLGGAYVYRYAADHVTQYRSRPEAFGNSDALNPATPFFVDTGSIASSQSQLVGAELLLVHGPFSVQSEMVYAPVSTDIGGSANFSGGYVATSFFLTGEHRRYTRSSATLDRVIPNHNFSPGWFLDRAEAGSGAWELAARLSFIDLNAGPIQGGQLEDTTFGLNWYLTPYHRFKANYILADLERSQQVTQTHIFGLRFDTDF